MKNHKIIVNFCPTGMVPTKQITSYVPISPEEIIEQTHEAYELGITIAHLHARDEKGVPTYEKKIYREIFEGVRKHCPELVICGSTSGRNFPEFEKRSEVIELMPDMCSLTLSSLNFIGQASINSPEMISNLVQKMNEHGVVPELECFDLGMINYGLYLIAKGLIKGPFYWNLLFGNISGFQAKASHLSVALNDIPADHYIAMAGFGELQLSINAQAIAMGLGVRVGLEDNIWWNKARGIKATNIQLLTRIHQLLAVSDKELFTAKDFGKSGFYNRMKNPID